MVFFIYMGGGAQGMALSAGLLVLSLVLNGGGWTHWELGGGGGGDYSYQAPGSRGRRRDGAHRAAAGVPRWQTHLTAALSVVIVVACGCGYALRYHPERRWVRRLRVALLSAQDAATRWAPQWQWQWQWQGDPAAGADQQPRARASQTHVAALPTETFVSEAALSNWGAAELKQELRRLHEAAAAQQGYDGGREARETEALLRGGVGVEKAELVRAVVAGRGGESGLSCCICLADYTDGGECVLRVLPCGHRFHSGCVDRWLVEQARTCPLCSKPV